MKSFNIVTETKSGVKLVIREISLADACAIFRIVHAKGFFMPYLSGAHPRWLIPFKKIVSPLKYVILANISRKLGWLLFGARRHWLMAIERVDDGRFLGVVLLDAVVRNATSTPLSEAILEDHKIKPSSKIGDGEIGFFIHPSHWRHGIAIQSVYALMSALASIPSSESVKEPILRRIWAETGEGNIKARTLLEVMGLVEDPEKAVDVSHRYDSKGDPIRLVHYTHTAGVVDTVMPVFALISHLEAGLIKSGWHINNSERVEG